MKVSVYRSEEGNLSVLVQASPGKGLAPVVLSDVTSDNVKERVKAAVDAMRGPKAEKLSF